MCAERRRQPGFTLIELVMFIVIVGIGLAGVLSALNITVKSSADPLQPKQALAIAEGLIEEILLRGYSNPVGGYTPTDCGAATPTDCDRSRFDDVRDFDLTGSGTTITTDGVGNAWPSGYTVTVEVTNTNIGPATKTVAARQVTVRVAYNGGDLTLIGYRGNY